MRSRIRIIPPDEFHDVVEIIAHGHSIFWSAANPDRRFTFDVFYQNNHWKNLRLARWLSNVYTTLQNEEVRLNLQSAIMNRLPHILYARDMARFYELQLDYFSRRELRQRFSMALAYHLNSFYLSLWGMLEQLAVLAKHACNLGIAERRCGIKSEGFWKEFSQISPSLGLFVQSPPISDWIERMADLRHPAAHRTMIMTAPIFQETEDSEKSEEELIVELKKRYKILYTLVPEYMAAQEPILLRMLRIGKMKQLAQTMVLVKGRNGNYMIDPILNLDYDLERLLAVMDAFLVRLFGSLRDGCHR